MTKIQKIVMRGFKSFGKRVEMLFGPGYNVVLGPNGSGKSNVLDSLTFVLGKGSSKGLRADKAANLIYNGGKTKKPSKEGEVSIYFDNSDKVFPTNDPSIKITRIVRHTGQSIYKINDKTRTRQQILDLLSIARINPDGSNIILQGDITRFVEMSPNERREIVEDIAGITVYEEKKHKALLEMEKVEIKLNEADIVLKERQVHLKELKSDRDQAMKFKHLEDQRDQNKASLLKIQIDEKAGKNKIYEDSINEEKSKIEKLQKSINELKSSVENKRENIKKLNEELEKRGDKEQQTLHKEVEKFKIDIATNRTRTSSNENEILRIASRKDQLNKSLEDLNEKINNLEYEKQKLQESKNSNAKDLKDIEKKISEFRGNYELDAASDIEKEMDEMDKKIDEKQRSVQSLREEQQELLREKDRLEYQVQTLDDKIEKVKEIEKEHKKEIESLKKNKEQLKIINNKLTTNLNESSNIVLQLNNAKNNLQKSEEDLTKLRTRNVGIKEKLSGGIATQKVLENRNRFGKVYGTVSELGNVDSKYSLALEVAAGARIKSIVVENDDVAVKCIKYLKSNKLGTATFLPLNKIKGKTIRADLKSFESKAGVHGFGVNLVSYDPKFKNVFSYVFGDTLVIDNIDTSKSIGIGKIRMSTLDGDLVEISGAMYGGFRKTQIGFQEKELSNEINKSEAKVNDFERVVSRLEAKKLDNEKTVDRLREERSALEGEIIKLERSLHLDTTDTDASKKVKDEFKSDLKNVEKRIDDVQEKITTINKELAGFKTEKEKLRLKISELRNPTLLAEINTFTQKKDQVKDQLNECETKIKNIETQVMDLLEPERKRTQEILKQHDREEKNFKIEIKEINEKIKEQEKELKIKEKQEKEFYSEFKGTFSKRDKVNEELQKDETNIIRKEEQIRGIDQRINTVSIDNARIKAELAALNEEFKQFDDIKIIKKPTEELKRELLQFERLVQDIGTVNFRAIEVYDSVEKEYNSLLKKKDVLYSEKEDVMMMMNEVESKKKDLFMKTLDGLAENFKRIFSALTSKGEVVIGLENPENPFEGGLGIKVRLVGNKFLDIRSLSGGEKTFTALAFIFAIQEYEPAPFYILDEVDAALDKRNSEKFADLIAKYAQKAQYIIISHNDGVISEAENLYGVSMDEHGITKVVSLKL
ncbi:chromosome segregation protein SMC [Candidatus Woesearchaeota archaeon]|nr:chromosome segregation protein SMC [Candidatus Woesearchaeota archaeon]